MEEIENLKEYMAHLGLTMERVVGRGYQFGLKDCSHKAMISDEAVLEASTSTKTIIHHTPECLKAQKEFFEFKEFIEGFGGYVPTPECNCPREEVPKDKSELLPGITKMILQRLIEKCGEMN